MSIPLPNLDDRQFADLVSEMQARIARYAPEWTNHNVADPGIMLLELFAWLTEAMIYRINRVPEQSRIRFVQTLGGSFQSAQPAAWKMRICMAGSQAPYTMPRDSALALSVRGRYQPLIFETLNPLPLTPSVAAYVNARQTTPVKEEKLGKSSGASFQLFPLSQSPIALPPVPFPIHPVVFVGDEPWQYTPHLAASQEDDAHFTVKPWLNMIAFGNGEHGRIPPKDAKIYVTYRSAATLDGVIRKEFVGKSSGRGFQYFALKKTILPVDLQELNSLEPQVMVCKQRWRYRPSISAMGQDEPEFTVEPWRNAIRFGNEIHGRIPPVGAEIKVSYRQTVRPMPTVATGAPLVLLPGAGTISPSQIQVSAAKMHIAGSDPTTFEQALDAAMAILKPRWRAIIVNDFEELVINSGLGIARARCLPGRNVTQPLSTRSWPGHVSMAVVPQAQYVLPKELGKKSRILALHPDGTRLVTVDGAEQGQLWDLEKTNRLRSFTNMRMTHHALFGADGNSLVVTGSDQIPGLYNAHSGELLAELVSKAQVIYSPQGAYLVDIGGRGAAYLRDTQDGAIIAYLGQRVEGDHMRRVTVLKAAFTADGMLLATADADNNVHLWTTLTGERSEPLAHPTPVRALAFSQDGIHLATLSNDGLIRLWRTDSARVMSTLPSQVLAEAIEENDREDGREKGATNLLFNADGSRLAVQIGERAWLWSARARKEMADLCMAPSLPGKPQEEKASVTISALRFSPDGNWLAVIEDRQVLRLWNARSGISVGGCDHGAPVSQVVFSPDSRMVLTLSALNVVRQWELAADRLNFTSVIQENGGLAALSPYGDWFCIVHDHLIHIWGAAQKKIISTLYHDLDAGEISYVAASASGRYLCTVAEEVHSSTPTGEGSKQTILVWRADHVFAVDALLKQRRLVTSQHHVAGPFYTDVYVRARLVLRSSLKTSAQLQNEICNHALSEFFHPLRGGVDGKGWQWGRNVYASEVYQILERIEGVDHVESLTLSFSPKGGTPVEESRLTELKIQPFHLVNYVVQADDIQMSRQAQLRQPQVTYRTR
jgi:WD40 repeat protein